MCIVHIASYKCHIFKIVYWFLKILPTYGHKMMARLLSSQGINVSQQRVGSQWIELALPIRMPEQLPQHASESCNVCGRISRDSMDTQSQPTAIKIIQQKISCACVQCHITT